jgi:GAF domain
MWNSLPSNAKVALKILWPIIATILTLSFSGIVGNRADSALLQLLPFLQQTTTVAVARWILILVIFLPSLAIIIPLALTALRYYRSQQAAISLVKLDDSLLRLLSSFKQNPDKQAATTLLFQEFLADTLELFKDGCRISILQPDNNDPDFLTIWQSFRVPSETIQRTKFYIGSNQADKRVGIAGLAFQRQTLMTVHLFWKKNQWVSDNPNYYTFIQRDTLKGMPYRAVVTVPIINNNNPNQCLGILCLDSMDEQAFDTKKVQDGLRSVADRVSAILLILENYS